MPGLRHDPGKGAGYKAGRNDMQLVVDHDTGGTNSYWICKNGRDNYNTGLCQILLPKVGVPWQFTEIDAVTYHCGSASDYDHDGDADNYNWDGPGLEVERLQGEALTPDQIYWLGRINAWLESEWGIPNVHYWGAPLTDGDLFHGHVNHRQLHPNPDGLSPEEWFTITATVAAVEEAKDLIVFKEENGKYWMMGLGDYVEVPLAVGLGASMNGAVVVPIKTTERIAMGIKAQEQAFAFLTKAKSKGII